MADIELKNITPGQKGSDVSTNIAYNFNALLNEIMELRAEIADLKNNTGSTTPTTDVTNAVFVSCTPTMILANTGEIKRVTIMLKVTNNNSELTYGSSMSLSEFYIQNLNTKIYGNDGSSLIGTLTMRVTSGKVAIDVVINCNSVNSGNISFDVIVNGLTYTQIVPISVINANQALARSVYVSTIFTRSEETPSRPTTGSYDNPVPNGWSDGIPSGTAKLWTCHRRFTSDGGGNQEAYWTTPVIVRDIENEMDVCFSACDTPGNPGVVHPSQESECWHNIGTEDDKWMAISLMENGVWGDWSILKIKGEDGKTPNHQVTIYKQALKNQLPTKPSILTPENFVDKNDSDIKNDTGETDTQTRNQQWKSKPATLTGDNIWWFSVGTVNGETGTVIYEWSDPLELSPAGESGQTMFMSTIFKRCSSDEITTPTPESTSFNNSVPTEQGWSDGIPADDGSANPIWESHRKFTSDSKYPQDDCWSTPVMMMDSANFDCCYSSDEKMPPEPTTHGIQEDEHWHNIGTSGDTWMATSYHNSFTSGWTPWVITQIKGESGDDGDYMKYIFKKSTTGVPEAPTMTRPSDFVDKADSGTNEIQPGVIDAILLARNRGWKSAPNGEIKDWYMSCALIDGKTGEIDSVTNPDGSWSTPVLTYGVQGPDGVGVSMYFDTNPIMGVQDISTELVNTAQTYSTLHLYEDGAELSGDSYSASVVQGDWTSQIDYTFQKNGGKYVFHITNFDKTAAQTKPNNGVATFNVNYKGNIYIVCCAWACNWLGTFRSVIKNDVKKDISDAVHATVNEFGNQYIKELNTTVEQSVSGWTTTAQRFEKELNTLTGKYTEIEKNIGNITISPDEFKAYAQKTTELGQQIASISATCDNISLIIENDDVEAGLKRTGIDIKNRIISLSADSTTFYDGDGKEIAVFANGGISTQALKANTLTAMNARVGTLVLNDAKAIDESGKTTVTINGSDGSLICHSGTFDEITVEDSRIKGLISSPFYDPDRHNYQGNNYNCPTDRPNNSGNDKNNEYANAILKWNMEDSGRIIRLTFYSYNGDDVGYGSRIYYAPKTKSGKQLYFYECGLKRTSIKCSRQLVELIGYSTMNNFLGYIVLNRIDVACEYAYGREPKVLAYGAATLASVSDKIYNLTYKTYDGSTMTISKENDTVPKTTISWTNSWVKDSSHLLINVTPMGYINTVWGESGGPSSNNCSKATLVNQTSNSFSVETSDDNTSKNNWGSYSFIIYNLDDWSWL